MTPWQFSKESKRANTMSTIDPIPGPLDVDTLARLANEYFSAWTGADPQTQAPPTFGLDRFPANFAPQTVGLPGEAELRALLESVAGERVLPVSEAARVPFDVNQIRRDFPILSERVNGRQLVWLDNAATTQKPQAVIDRLKYFYEHENSNIHRAAHELAARATDAYEGARERVRAFLNASSVNECVFVRGATEAINLVAQSWGRSNVGKDDEIVITWLEHHANIVPWQQLANENGARLRVAPVDETGQIILEEYGKLLGPKTRLVAFPQVSNALGTVTPAKRMVEMAHGAGAKVLVDGAQSISHMRTDVQALDSDWYVFSGHKVFGPTGIGVLHGKEALLNEMSPWQGGGNMIEDVTFEHTLYRNAPARFEAGTGNIADAVGLGAALDYLTKVGIDPIGQYEHELLTYATRLLKEIPGLRLIGTAAEKAGVISFVLNGYKTEDIGAALNREGIAVRSGHHCAQPVLRRFGVESTVRASLALYNTCADIDSLVMALTRLNSRTRTG
jgi:cysteine desulfurase/selenocysteine lyase